MANFAPMKQRFLLLLQENLRLFSIRGRFLDYGCGSGDVGEHLMERCGMPQGTGYDPALDAAEIARRAASAPSGLVYRDCLDEAPGGYDFAVLFDVIEHVADAPGALRELHREVAEEGWLFVTVPYNRLEWGIDDLFYGHLRRLSRRGVISLLEDNGWTVIRTLDPTFPTFWLIRRLYLLLTRLSPRARARHLEAAGTDLDRSLVSSTRSSWESMGPLPRLLSSVLVPWKLIRRFDLYFESVFLGFELFVVARRRGGSDGCEVCANGRYTHHRFFERTSRQTCSYCRSELLLPRPAPGEGPPPKRPRRPLRRLQAALRRPRARALERLEVPERSVLDVGSRDPWLVRRLETAGWRVRATRVEGEARASEPAAPAADERFGLVTLFHVVEHASSLARALDEIDRRVLPGGYLVLEYPSARSLLKRLLGSRWFGYDPPYHRLLIDPLHLADRLGLKAYRLVRESQLSAEYSAFIFAQSVVNALLPFQRDALYRVLASRPGGIGQRVAALVSLPLFAAALALFPVHQAGAWALRRGCVVRQVFQKTDVPGKARAGNRRPISAPGPS